MVDFDCDFHVHIQQFLFEFDHNIEMRSRQLIIYFLNVVNIEQQHNEKNHNIQYISSKIFYIDHVYQDKIRLCLYNDPLMIRKKKLFLLIFIEINKSYISLRL